MCGICFAASTNTEITPPTQRSAAQQLTTNAPHLRQRRRPLVAQRVGVEQQRLQPAVAAQHLAQLGGAASADAVFGEVGGDAAVVEGQGVDDIGKALVAEVLGGQVDGLRVEVGVRLRLR